MTDIQLQSGDAVLNVDSLGGGMRALAAGDWTILDGYDVGQAHSGRRGHILAPWPNRIHRGRYTWQGEVHELPISDQKHESATHGLVDRVEWDVDVAENDRAALSVRVPPTDGYPFHVRVNVRYELWGAGLTVVLGAVNVGDRDAPFGAGMHPYFRCGTDADATRITLPVSSQLRLDHNGTPTGAADDFDGLLGEIGGRVFDAALRRRDSPSGWAELAGPAGTLRIEMGSSFRWLMLFTGDTLPEGERRRSVAVEPMTCPPNAFATSTDVVTLRPGEPWEDRWSLGWIPR